MHFGPRSERLLEEQLQLVWKPSSRRSPKKTRRRRSGIPSGARRMPPSAAPTADRGDTAARGHRVPVLPGDHDGDRGKTPQSGWMWSRRSFG